MKKITIQRHALLKALVLMVLSVGCFYASFAFAQDETLGSVAYNITKTFGNVAKLITAGSFLAGLGFAAASILKFKAHRDNPTQVSIGVPIMLLIVAAALLFLPSVFKVAGRTMFASGGTETGIAGTTTITHDTGGGGS